MTTVYHRVLVDTLHVISTTSTVDRVYVGHGKGSQVGAMTRPAALSSLLVIWVDVFALAWTTDPLLLRKPVPFFALLF